MGFFSLEAQKQSLREVRQETSEADEKLGQLTEQRHALERCLDQARAESLDDDTRKCLIASLERELADNAAEADRVAADLRQTGEGHVTEVRKEVDESRRSALDSRANLVDAETLLDRFGLGENVRAGEASLEHNVGDLDAVDREAEEALQELQAVAASLEDI